MAEANIPRPVSITSDPTPAEEEELEENIDMMFT